MSGFWWVMGLVAMFVFAAIGDIVSDEIRGWLDRLPRGVLKLATLRLDPADRETTYQEVWGPDLDYYLKGDESRPITRLIRGMAFAVSLAWRVRSADAPPPEPAEVTVRLATATAALSGSGTLGGTSATVSRAFGDIGAGSDTLAISKADDPMTPDH